ncbi:MAG: hypothetical protein AVO39_10415 [delta proteobacterium MLS_D]|jgi:hypothetical protein|nr:MAG: hypothetical protein AVO39_10415 [delta proteobacterium MLS_D]
MRYITLFMACLFIMAASPVQAWDDDWNSTYRRGTSYSSSNEDERDGYRRGMLHQQQEDDRFQRDPMRINPRDEQTLGDPAKAKPRGSRSLLY